MWASAFGQALEGLKGSRLTHNGNIHGTASAGGAYGDGVVFQIGP
jgi:uncharacterized repeat protein (TIGR03803 family)